MTLQQLEYILAVDKCRHFGKAADVCNVTQPTLSAMIGKLEEELNVKIFDRTRQPISPTPVGELVIRQAQEVLYQSNRIKDIIEEERHSLTGIFRVGILPTIAPYLLPRFFPQLMKKYPQLDIRVREMKTSEIKKALAEGELEAGILAKLAGLEEFAETHLCYEKYVGYVSREDKLFGQSIIRTSDVAASKDLWLLDEGHCFRDQMVRFCQMKGAQTSQLAYNLGSIETFMRMVESGKGITFIPELAADQLNEIQQELVRPFAVPVPTRQLVLITQLHFVRQTVIDTLVNEIQASVPKDMLKLKGTQILV
ncbi:MAG: hydrogen peroxide-inducible genes activator [Bacteroidaceae bacterium]|nr:hydrogen peroxide-inducible genes activator [Bacteroidaceae bacterium]